MQWVDCKERGDNPTAPERPSSETQEDKQQDGVDRVQSGTDKQVRAGIHSEQLHVQHVRDPRQRKPVKRVHMREGPHDSRPGQTAKDLLVFRDVQRIIEVHKLMASDLRVNGEDQDDQRGNDGKERQATFRRANDSLCTFVPSASMM